VSSSLIRQDFVPMVVGYVLIMTALAIGLRIVQRSGKAEAAGAAALTGAGRSAGPPDPAPVAAPVPAAAAAGAAPAAVSPARDAGPVTARARLRSIMRPEPGWRRLAIFSLSTAVGGYLVLMAVIVAYYYGVARAGGNFVQSAFSGCAMLIGLAAPVFLVLSWLAERKGWRI
jgi:hypothetical protein